MTIQPELTVAELNKGTDRTVLTQKLVDMGVEQAEAGKYITEVQKQLAEVAQAEQMNGTEYLPGTIGGLTGGIIGGVLWGLLTMTTNKEYGMAAIGIGLLAGGGVLLAAGKKKGLPLQVIAAATSVIGILTGKYYTFIAWMNAERAGGGGGPLQIIDYISLETMQIFFMNMVKLLSGFDALWVVLAVITAWGMLKPMASSKVVSNK
jgi:hypothetical protein